MTKLPRGAWICAAFAALGYGCVAPSSRTDDAERFAFLASGGALLEDFESGAKASYASGDVAVASGVWRFDDALIGSLTGDVRDGGKAARLRNAGSIAMEFDVSGASSVSIAHASYESDAASTWALFASYDHGNSWSQVGATVTSGSALATVSFALASAGPVRLQVRKTDASGSRLDIDDVSIDGAGSGSGSGSSGSGSSSGTGEGAAVSVHTKLGLPSAASLEDPNAYLSVKAQYVLSFNSDRRTPNWVSWELNASYLGSAPRSDNFRSDDTLPATLHQATNGDFNGSGYSRGHMCPSGDRTSTMTANGQTFYLTNMVPQVTNNNAGPWEHLEDYERSLASSGHELVIVAGGLFSANPATIGAGVAVPTDTFKVIVVLDHTGDGVSEVTTSTRVIAVSMPNNNADIHASDTWQQYRVSARSLEQQTGLDFLSDVPGAIQDAVETRVDDQ